MKLFYQLYTEHRSSCSKASVCTSGANGESPFSGVSSKTVEKFAFHPAEVSHTYEPVHYILVVSFHRSLAPVQDDINISASAVPEVEFRALLMTYSEVSLGKVR